MILILNLLFLNEADFLFSFCGIFFFLTKFCCDLKILFYSEKNQMKFISCASDQEEMMMHTHIKMNGFSIHSESFITLCISKLPFNIMG